MALLPGDKYINVCGDCRFIAVVCPPVAYLGARFNRVGRTCVTDRVEGVARIREANRSQRRTHRRPACAGMYGSQLRWISARKRRGNHNDVWYIDKCYFSELRLGYRQFTHEVPRLQRVRNLLSHRQIAGE